MKFFFNLILVLILGCKSPTLILKEPELESTPGLPGLVVFGLFIYDDTSTNFFEENAKFKLPAIDHSFFYAVKPLKKELDPSSKIYINPRPSGENIEIQGKVYNEQNRISIRNEYITYFLFSNLEAETEYVFESTGYSFTTVLISVRGKRTNQLNYVNIPLQLEDPSKILKFKASPGKISFLGNFLVRVNIEGKKNFLDFDEKKIGIIENANSNVNSFQNKELIKSLYGNEEISERGAEIHFLKQLLVNTREGYWRKKTEERLFAITKN